MANLSVIQSMPSIKYNQHLTHNHPKSQNHKTCAIIHSNSAETYQKAHILAFIEQLKQIRLNTRKYESFPPHKCNVQALKGCSERLMSTKRANFEKPLQPIIVVGTDNDTINKKHNKRGLYKRANSLPGLKKSVTFADTKGGKLARVKLISESFDEPPIFLTKRNSIEKQKPKYNSKITQLFENSKSNKIFAKNLNCSESSSDDESNSDEDYFEDGEIQNSRADTKNLVKLIEALKNSNRKKEESENKKILDRQRASSYDDAAYWSSYSGSSFVDSSMTNSTSSSISSCETITNSPAYSKYRNTYGQDKIIRFQATFQQPTQNTSNLIKKLAAFNICLERAYIDVNKHLRGTVLVKNIGFEKTVCIKISVDYWANIKELELKWLRSNLDQSHDIFQFNFDLAMQLTEKPIDLAFIEKVCFCLKYNVNGQEYWDNNSGKNYNFQQI